MTPSLRPGIHLRVLAARLGRRVRSALPSRRTTYVSQRVSEYRGYWSEGASAIGATFSDVCAGVWEVKRGDRRTQLANFVTQCDDPVILRLAGDKTYAYQLAASARVPVPEHCVITLATIDEAERFRRAVEGPLVVKPAAGSSSGLGVSTGIEGSSELTSAIALASLYDERILIERMIPGESYRLLFLGGRLIHAVRRRGIRVAGDGRATVRELLSRRGMASLEHDASVRQTLRAQRLSLDTIPASGQEVLVRGIPDHSSGGRGTRELRTVYDESVIHRCSPDLAREAGKVVCALGSELAGVDLITTDPSVSLHASKGAFIEINTTPGIHHHYVTQGDVVETPVAATVLEYLLARACTC